MKLSVRDISHKYEKTTDLGLITLTPAQTKRVQEITFEIYKSILFVCNKYGLHVSLSGGSALGAVRHQGFIPWDDDIDVMMPRQDFEKFMQVFNKELGEKYYMACPNAHYSDQYNYIIKIINKDTIYSDVFKKQKLFHQGCAVDVLPIDYVSNNTIVYFIKGWVSIILLFIINSNMMYLCETKQSRILFTQTFCSSCYYYFRLAIGLITSLIPYHKWCLWFNKWISMKKNTKRVSIPSGRNHYFKETQKASVFYPFKRAVFEDTTSFIPNDANVYLRDLYGVNYMSIPPEEKRETHICSKLIL